jgi:diguanylate cyclase (GGDEF)-like protein
MASFFTALDRIPRPVILSIGLALALTCGFFDYITVYEVGLSIFYVIPVALVTWYIGRQAGIFISIFCVLLWLATDLFSTHQFESVIITTWDSIMRLGFFLVIVYSLAQVRRLLRREEELARIDFLTGVANSRYFYEVANREIERSNRFNRILSIAYIDVDNFKMVNDSFGHSVGNDLLRTVAQTMKKNVRLIDTVARLGGDEFTVLFPETDADQVKSAVAKIQKSLEDNLSHRQWPVTFSIGVVTCSAPGCSLDKLLKKADALMYESKAGGKNRATFSNPEPPAG